MSSTITSTDVVSTDFFSQIEKFKAMQLISDTVVHTCAYSDSDSDDDFDMDWMGAKEFMRLEDINIGLITPVFDPEALYSIALLPLAHFNVEHKTDFEFHKFLRAYMNNAHPMYIVFEAISPTIGGGELPLVFQSHIGLPPGWPIREEVYFCRLHPIDCSYTLDDLPVSSSTDQTKARVLAAAAFTTYEMGRRLTLKDIVSFEETVEPSLLGGFDFLYKIIFHVFKTKDASYVSGPIETLVSMCQDLKEMKVISFVEKEMTNEAKDE